MLDKGRLAVEQLRGTIDYAAVRDADCLESEADTEDR
jgi:hypothetical protein